MSTIVTAVEARIATVVLNRPERRNALTGEMLDALAASLLALDDDADVDVVVLTGAGRAFCAGVDLDQLAETGQAPAVSAPLPRIGKPLIGAVNGAAVTGGLELALMCDLLVASDRAAFRDTHARIGLLPGWGLTARLPAVMGLRAATAMLLTGRVVDAAEALRLGLVVCIAPHESLHAVAMTLAEEIVAADQPAVRAMLALLRDGAGDAHGAALLREREAASAWQGAGIDDRFRPPSRE